MRLADKFADHGLIAVALAEAKGEALAIDTLLMSCRVIGRGVEALALAEPRPGPRRAVAGGRGCLCPDRAQRHGGWSCSPGLGMAETGCQPDGTARFWAAPGEKAGGATAILAVERV